MKNQGFINRLEAGNAFIIILIMIALLTALTLSITRMGNNSSEVSQEQAGVIASQVLRQAKTLTNGVDSLLSKGCSFTQLSFENSTVTGYLNGMSPSDKSCWLFDASGAGMNFPLPPSKANNGTNWAFVRNDTVIGVGIERETGVHCPGNCQDVIAVLPFISLEVCKAINLSVQVSPSYSTAPPQNYYPVDIIGLHKFSNLGSAPSITNLSIPSTSFGTYIAVGNTYNRNQPLFDKKSGCAEATGGYFDMTAATVSGVGKYFFYQVLYER